MVRDRERDRTGFSGRTRAPSVTPPEVRLMRPSGVTRHPASGTTITFDKTFRFAEGAAYTLFALSSYPAFFAGLRNHVVK